MAEQKMESTFNPYDYITTQHDLNLRLDDIELHLVEVEVEEVLQMHYISLVEKELKARLEAAKAGKLPPSEVLPFSVKLPRNDKVVEWLRNLYKEAGYQCTTRPEDTDIDIFTLHKWTSLK